MEKVKKLKSIMASANIDAALISSVSNIIYLTNYSGFSETEREAYLFITKNHEYLLTDGRYTEAVKNIENFTLLEINPTAPLKKILENLIEKHRVKVLGIEEENITFLEYKRLKKHCKKIVNIKGIDNLRTIKNKDEIAKIESACKLGDKTFEHILTKIKEGITEKEIAFEIEFFIKKQNADISFRPIVAFGKNSAIPHHLSRNEILKNNQFVLLDFGVKLNNYCSDMTRTVFYGKPNAKQKKMYQTVLDAQQKSLDYLKSSIVNGKSINASNVDKAARDYILSQAFESIPHSVGHGIGIEVHEKPYLSFNSKDILKENMVFSIEPGIYLPETGGVRIEDLVVLEKNGPRLLTKSLKKLIIL